MRVADDRERSPAPSSAGRPHPWAWLTRAWARGPAVAGRRRPGPRARAAGLGRTVLAAAVLALTLAFPGQAAALTLSRQDALIIVRSLLMLVPRPPADASIVVLPAGPGQDQVAAAEASAALLRSATANARVVPLDRVAEATDAIAVLVPPGTPAEVVGAIPERALLIGFDPECVSLDRCLLYIQTAGQVSITLNRQRMARSGLRFDPAYRLLMNER